MYISVDLLKVFSSYNLSPSWPLFFVMNRINFCTQAAYYFHLECLTILLHVYDPFICRELGLDHILGKLDQMTWTKLTWHTGLWQITLELFHLPLLMGLVQVGY